MGDQLDQLQTWADLQELESCSSTGRNAVAADVRFNQSSRDPRPLAASTIAYSQAADAEIILHVDIDSFYCEVERMDDASLRGKPLVVQQFNSGGFVAVSYEARRCGIKKGDGVGAGGRANIRRLKEIGAVSTDEAKRRCPGLIVKPMRTDRYREVAMTIQASLRQWAKGRQVEKASYDDFYLVADVWGRQQSGAVQHQGQLGEVHIIGGGTLSELAHDLQIGCQIALEIQQSLRALGLSSSIGVSRRKLLSRLISPLNKPMAVSAISDTHAVKYLHLQRIENIPGFQGMLGQHVCQALGVQTVGQLSGTSETELARQFGASKAVMLTRLSRGDDLQPVLERGPQKTIICERSCPPLTTVQSVQELVQTLSLALAARLTEDSQRSGQRVPSKLQVSWRQAYGASTSTRSAAFPPACASALSQLAAGNAAEDLSLRPAHDTLVDNMTSCAMGLLLAHVPHPWAITRLVVGGSFAPKPAAPTACAGIQRFLKTDSQAPPQSKSGKASVTTAVGIQDPTLCSSLCGEDRLQWDDRPPAPALGSRKSPEATADPRSSKCAESVAAVSCVNKSNTAPHSLAVESRSQGVMGKHSKSCDSGRENHDVGADIDSRLMLSEIDIQEQRQIWHQIRTDKALGSPARECRSGHFSRGVSRRGRMAKSYRKTQNPKSAESGSIVRFLRTMT